MMTNTPWGLHLPNPDAPTMDVPRWTGIIGNGCYTVLHLQRFCLPELRTRAPSALIMVRFYLSNWTDWKPADWAGFCADLYRRDIAPWTKHVTWANEQNLAAESGGRIGSSDTRRATEADYREIHRWNMAFLDSWAAQPGTRDAVLHYPAFASGHSDDQNDWGFVGLAICRPGIDRCPILDRHIYWSVGGGAGPEGTGVGGRYGTDRINLASTLFPLKPLFISEAGNFAVTDPRSPVEYPMAGRRWATLPDLLGFTFFIADDPTGAHAANNLSRNGAVLDAIARARHDSEPEEPPMPTVGPGFQKAVPLIGPFVEDEIYHAPGTDHEVSLAIGAKGYATWSKRLNQVIVVCDDGRVFDDRGNAGDGYLIQVAGPFH